MCARKQCILCPALRYVALHYSMLHRFEFFSSPETIAHGSISCRVFARLLVGNYNWSRRLPSSPRLKAYYSRSVHQWSSRPASKASLAWVSISGQLFWWVWKSRFRVNFLCRDCYEGCRSFGNALFLKSQVFLDFRAQVFELSEETQGVATGVHHGGWRLGGETSASEQKSVMQWTGTLFRNVACFRLRSGLAMWFVL